MARCNKVATENNRSEYRNEYIIVSRFLSILQILCSDSIYEFDNFVYPLSINRFDLVQKYM